MNITDASLIPTENGSSLKQTIGGVLYFPEGDVNCYGFPTAANNKDGLLQTGLGIIAVIPMNETCLAQYLSKAAEDRAIAALIYEYDPSESIVVPNDFAQPMFGISTDEAQSLVQNMVLYAGNISNAPSSNELSTYYNPGDIVRLNLTVFATAHPSQSVGLSIPLFAGLLGGMCLLGLIIGLVLFWRCSQRCRKRNKAPVVLTTQSTHIIGRPGNKGIW